MHDIIACLHNDTVCSARIWFIHTHDEKKINKQNKTNKIQHNKADESRSRSCLMCGDRLWGQAAENANERNEGKQRKLQRKCPFRHRLQFCVCVFMSVVRPLSNEFVIHTSDSATFFRTWPPPNFDNSRYCFECVRWNHISSYSASMSLTRQHLNSNRPIWTALFTTIKLCPRTYTQTDALRSLSIFVRVPC